MWRRTSSRSRAVDVSEKTVFNYFATKEDLVFFRSEEHIAARVDAMLNRPPGVPLSCVFEQDTMDFLDVLEAGEIETLVAVPRLVRSSPALRGRLMLWWEHEAAALTTAVREDLIAAVVVRTLVCAHREIFRAATRRLLDGEHPMRIANDLRLEARRVYARLDDGLQGYGG